MPKLTRPSEPAPPATATMHLLRRAVMLLKLRSPIEKQIIKHILWEGRDLRWTLYTRRNMAEEFGCIFEVHPDAAKRILRRLVNRGWLRRGKDSEGQPYIQLTTKFVEVCMLEDQRMKVRRALGPGAWQKINGNDEVADELHTLALTKTQARYKARVHAAAVEFIADARTLPKQGDRSVPSQGTDRSPRRGQLRLLAGDRSVPSK